MDIKQRVRKRLVRAGLREGVYTDLLPDWIPGTDEWVYIDEIANRQGGPTRSATRPAAGATT